MKLQQDVVENSGGAMQLRARDAHRQIGDVFARPQSFEVAIGLRGRRTFDVHVAIDVFLLPDFEIRRGEVAAAGDVSLAVDDDKLLVHALEHP